MHNSHVTDPLLNRSTGQASSPLPLAARLGGISLGRPDTVPQQELPRDVSSRFGVRLRELRVARDMTQLRMATVFGIDRSFISDVERGRKSISLPMLEVIALGMRVSLSDLLRDL